jgi:hypothetical protein
VTASLGIRFVIGRACDPNIAALGGRRRPSSVPASVEIVMRQEKTVAMLEARASQSVVARSSSQMAILERGDIPCDGRRWSVFLEIVASHLVDGKNLSYVPRR